MIFPRWFAEGRLRVDGGVVRFDGRPLAAPLLVNGTADAAA